MKSLGSILRFKDINKESKGFILRHDIDFDLGLALEMAIIERDNDVKSTYFVLTGCETYNALSNSNRAIILNMLKMGHEIGLHFDPTRWHCDIETGFQEEVRILSEIIGKDIKSVSLHNPSVHNQYPSFNGFNNAYDNRYFGQDRYLSDSSMNFRGKAPFSFIENVKSVELMQVLIHPMHYSDLFSGYGEITAQTFVSNMNKFYADWCVNETFVDDVGPSYLECFLHKLKL